MPQVIAQDVAVQAGIAETVETFGVLVHDMNMDGWPDIFLGRHGGLPARLYLNDQSGHFAEVDAGTFARSDRHHCDAADVDGNGLPDIVCARGSNDGNSVKANELWMQGPVNTFVNRPGEWTVLDSYARGKRPLFIDANGDGRPDLFLGNDPSRADGLPSRNHLLLNTGSAFRYAPALGVDQDIGARCVVTADLDNDGRQDLLVCAEETGVRLYRNEGRTFVDVSASMGIPQSNDVKSASLTDVDGDGSVDLVQVRSRELQIFLQTPTGFELVFATDLEDGNGVAAGDANADGHPDLFVLQKGVPNDPDLMLINDGSGRGYAEMAIPEADSGEGDDVVPLDYDHNGYTDFLVVNGHEHPGPVQLIAFFPGPGLVQAPGRGANPGSGPVAPLETFGTLQTLTEQWKDTNWTIAPSPNPSRDNNTLRATASLGIDDIWSVGFWVAGSGAHTLTEHWDGQGWSVVPTSDLGTNDYLFDVAALSDSDVWAVGTSRMGGADRTLTEHWDGSSWTVVPSPSVGSEANYLHSVAAFGADDVWAVGRYAQDGTYRTLTEHWDGSSWTVVASPNIGDGHNALLSLSTQSGRFAWAVGYRYDGAVFHTLVERWNGQAWKVIESPSARNRDNLLLGVSGTWNGDVWAVGYKVVGGALRTLVEHWDGGAWKVVSSPSPGEGAATLRSVVASGPSDVWALGMFYDPLAGYTHTLTMHWDGSTWTAVDSPSRDGQDNELLDVTKPDQQEEIVWAVGHSYNVIKG